MPIYEFGCKKCRKKFEKIVTPGRTPASAACPGCGTRSPRLISRFAVAGATHKSEGGDFGGDDGDDFGDSDDYGGHGGDDFGDGDSFGGDDLD